MIKLYAEKDPRTGRLLHTIHREKTRHMQWDDARFQVFEGQSEAEALQQFVDLHCQHRGYLQKDGLLPLALESFSRYGLWHAPLGDQKDRVWVLLRPNGTPENWITTRGFPSHRPSDYRGFSGGDLREAVERFVEYYCMKNPWVDPQKLTVETALSTLLQKEFFTVHRSEFSRMEVVA